MKLTKLHLVQRLKMHGFVHPLPHTFNFWYIKYTGKFVLTGPRVPQISQISCIEESHTHFSNIIQSYINLLVAFCCLIFCQVILNHVFLTTDLMLQLPVTLLSPNLMAE